MDVAPLVCSTTNCGRRTMVVQGALHNSILRRMQYELASVRKQAHIVVCIKMERPAGVVHSPSNEGGVCDVGGTPRRCCEQSGDAALQTEDP